MNKLFLASLALIFSIGVLPYASADGGGVYSVHDADRDGYLDRSEFEKFVASKRKRSRGSDNWDFDSADSDGDNNISEQEMVNALIENMKRKKRNR
jgi:Ca2+-binding EF-hand superfamily protein